jgi:Mrp family chromosome partitioning ATPase
MSTLDQAFIRAYTKEADLRAEGGAALADLNEADEAVPSPDPRLAAWRPLEQLYAEGIWYRIEPRQPAPPVPHKPVRAFSGAQARRAASSILPPPNATPAPSQAAPPQAAPNSAAIVADALDVYLGSQFVVAAGMGLPTSDGANVPAEPPAAAVSQAEAEPAGVANPSSADPSSANPSSAGPLSAAPARLDNAAASNIPAPHFAVATASKLPTAAPPGSNSATASSPSASPSAVQKPGPQAAAQQPAAPQGAAQPSTSHRGFQPSWEVDALAWPELTDRLLRRESRRFSLLAEKLAEVARSGRNVIAITSPAREQGRTTLALCLARRAAAAGLKVALVDADFDNPRLAQQLRINPTCGWQDTVAARLPLSEAAVASMRDNVTLLPLRLGSVARHDDPALDPATVTELFDRLSSAFDLVLLDMEPVDPADAEGAAESSELVEPNPSAPAASPRLHNALAALVVYDASSSEEQLADAVLQLRSAGIETIGAVENFSAPA